MSTDAQKTQWNEGVEAVDYIDTTVVRVEGIHGDVMRIIDDLRRAFTEAGFIATKTQNGIIIIGSSMTRTHILSATLRGVARVYPEMRVLSNGTMPRRSTSAIPSTPEEGTAAA